MGLSPFAPLSKQGLLRCAVSSKGFSVGPQPARVPAPTIRGHSGTGGKAGGVGVIPGASSAHFGTGGEPDGVKTPEPHTSAFARGRARCEDTVRCAGMTSLLLLLLLLLLLVLVVGFLVVVGGVVGSGGVGCGPVWRGSVWGTLGQGCLSEDLPSPRGGHYRQFFSQIWQVVGWSLVGRGVGRCGVGRRGKPWDGGAFLNIP